MLEIITLVLVGLGGTAGGLIAGYVIGKIDGFDEGATFAAELLLPEIDETDSAGA